MSLPTVAPVPAPTLPCSSVVGVFVECLAHGGDAGLYVGAYGGVAKGKVEDTAGAHDGHLRGADGQTNAAALEFASDAACSLEAKADPPERQTA